MKKNNLEQLTFERGIVENYKQDALTEGNKAQSVLFMENWNPNIEAKSLVVRCSTGLVTESIPDRFVYDPVTDDYTKVYKNLEYAQHPGNTPIGLFKFYTTQPNGQTIRCILNSLEKGFIKGPIHAPNVIEYAPATEIDVHCGHFYQDPVNPTLNYVWDYPLDNYLEYDWWNASQTFFSDAYLEPATIWGKVTNFARWGEAIYLVTNDTDMINAVNQGNIPSKEIQRVYKFAFWDKRFIRDGKQLYLDGIDLSDAPFYLQVKGERKCLPNYPFAHWRVFGKQFDLKNEINIWYVPLDDNNYLDSMKSLINLETNQAKGDDFFGLINVLIWEHSAQCGKNKFNAKGRNMVYTIEDTEPSIMALVQAENPIHVGNDPELDAYRDDAIVFNEFSNAVGVPDVSSEISIRDWTFHASKDGQMHKIWTGTDWEEPANTGTTSNFDTKDGFDWNGARATIGFALYDYITNATPRGFLKGERIPIVITAICNGVEKVISEFTYEVKGSETVGVDLRYGGQMKKRDSQNTNGSWWDPILDFNAEWNGEETILHNGRDATEPKHYYNNNYKFSVNMTYPMNVVGPSALFKETFGLCPQAVEASQYDDVCKVSDKHFEGSDTWNIYYGVNPTSIIELYQGEFFEENNDKHCSAKVFCNLVIPIRPRIICFSILLDKSKITQLLENGLTSIRVYVSRPNTNSQMIKSLTNQLLSVPSNLYCHPLALANQSGTKDYTQYGLVKEFLLAGEGNVIRDWHKYDQRCNVANGWMDMDNDVCTDSIIAISSDIEGDPTSMHKVPYKHSSGKIAWYNFIIGISGNAEGEDLSQVKSSPDNCIWDYPADTPTLNLQYSNEEWKGLGAGLIAVAGGVVFLGDCINEFGQKEPGVIRWSLIQSGNTDYSTYPKENQITFGQEYHTALLVYREQLIAFNRNAFYRMAVANAYTPEEWEVLEVVQGHGAFSQKLVCLTPLGFCFCDEYGIWISDGRLPQCLTTNPDKGLFVQNIYQKMILGLDNKVLSHLKFFKIHDSRNIQPNDKRGFDGTFNPSAELHYNQETDELILSCEILERAEYTTADNTIDKDFVDLRIGLLIYSFNHNNWRFESVPIKNIANWKQIFGLPLGNITNVPDCEFGIVDKTNVSIDDTTLRIKFMQFDRFNNEGTDEINQEASNIKTDLITHELGDGQNDNILHSAIVEASPYKNVLSTGGEHNDPIFAYNLRNEIDETAMEDNWLDTFVDIVAPNTNVKRLGTSDLRSSFEILQSPKASSGLITLDTQDMSDSAAVPYNLKVGSESFRLLFPLATKFRRCIFRYSSRYTKRIKSFIINYVTMKRRKE